MINGAAQAAARLLEDVSATLGSQSKKSFPHSSRRAGSLRQMVSGMRRTILPPPSLRARRSLMARQTASGDRDTYQLASERTTILQPIRAGEMARKTAGLRARYGVDPKQVPDFNARGRAGGQYTHGKGERSQLMLDSKLDAGRPKPPGCYT
jgi:hypothetical protein